MAEEKGCPRCGAVVGPDDRFCRACGSAIGGGSKVSPPPEPRQVLCPSCGEGNSPDATLCRSCGIQLKNPPPKKKTQKRAQPASGNFFTSWKIVAFTAVLLAVAIIIARQYGGVTSGKSADLPPGQAGREIDSLREIVSGNPDDVSAVLHLANVLSDNRLFQQSIEMYGRYLRIRPSDADARVDMGVAFFEMSFTDSIRQTIDLGQARDIFQEALTYAPGHQKAMFNLGVVDLHLGETTTAVDWLSKCIAVDSTAEIAHRARDLITQHPFTNQSPK
jgi:ribosomal protein L40E